MKEKTLKAKLLDAINDCGIGGSFSLQEIAQESGMSKTGVSTYLCCLRRLGNLKHYPDEARPWTVVKKITDYSKVNSGGRSYSSTKPTGCSNSKEMPWDEMLETIEYIIDEYVPHLESELKKAKQDYNDLYNQFNRSFDRMRKSPIIYNRPIIPEKE